MILDRKCFFKQMGTILLSWQLLVGQIYQPISLNSLSSCHVCKLNKSLLVKVSTLFFSRSFQHATWAIKPVLVGTLPSFYHCRPYNVLVWACPHMSPTIPCWKISWKYWVLVQVYNYHNFMKLKKRYQHVGTLYHIPCTSSISIIHLPHLNYHLPSLLGEIIMSTRKLLARSFLTSHSIKYCYLYKCDII